VEYAHHRQMRHLEVVSFFVIMNKTINISRSCSYSALLSMTMSVLDQGFF